VEIDALTLPHMGHGQAVCTCASLRVRDDPNLNARVIGRLVRGQTVDVWVVAKDWWRVQTEDGLTGWCSDAYLKPVRELVRGTA